LHFDKESKKTVTKKAYENFKKNKFIDGIDKLKYNYNINNEYINISYFDSIIIPYNNQLFQTKDFEIEDPKFKKENRYAGTLKMRFY
jgi:hypothetical protein